MRESNGEEGMEQLLKIQGNMVRIFYKNVGLVVTKSVRFVCLYKFMFGDGLLFIKPFSSELHRFYR
jgi:hypothetical protein